MFLAKIFSVCISYCRLSNCLLHTDKSYFLQKNNLDLLKSEHHLRKWKLKGKGQRRLCTFRGNPAKSKNQTLIITTYLLQKANFFGISL